eukprot:365470-Chlamydomonas_euryale.AAC.1
MSRVTGAPLSALNPRVLDAAAMMRARAQVRVGGPDEEKYCCKDVPALSALTQSALDVGAMMLACAV